MFRTWPSIVACQPISGVSRKPRRLASRRMSSASRSGLRLRLVGLTSKTTHCVTWSRLLPRTSLNSRFMIIATKYIVANRQWLWYLFVNHKEFKCLELQNELTQDRRGCYWGSNTWFGARWSWQQSSWAYDVRSSRKDCWNENMKVSHTQLQLLGFLRCTCFCSTDIPSCIWRQKKSPELDRKGKLKLLRTIQFADRHTFISRRPVIAAWFWGLEL